MSWDVRRKKAKRNAKGSEKYRSISLKKQTEKIRNRKPDLRKRKKASERTSDDKSGESEEEEAFYSAGYDSI